MKLLFDENLSPRLPRALQDLFPESAHVRDVGLRGASDDALWRHARDHGFVLISKDADFNSRSVLSGHPPKVIWLRIGNAPTSTIEARIRAVGSEIGRFEQDPEASLLTID